MKNFFIALTLFRRAGIRLHCTLFVMAVLLGLFAASGSVMSQDFYVYPKAGQTAETVNRDKFECHEWAKQQTGIDPNRVATDVRPQQVEQRGGAFGGAARGAAVGAIGGAIAGDAGKGAAIGAGIGALGGNRRRRHSQQQQMQAYEQANQQQQALMETFNRAYRACLEGRDYSVN
ncbi:MAG: hypothetical protein D8M57_16635 [Candidatus Scalindua sp. AMX11]|nr:MAG: hypothetical protein DWQ00_06650 [Candidatus Scalindua sp.]NOG84254.1 hypothetical protein [Planctomycetota bacterium]RZV68287.1 MAG: hypothetical protein EX341_16585 [Candidatus Scalindua sp. SCAELEC01]TDE63766.1 MAG: hypothetical protein D8M57_16635 [Candidatus Scalindua sp. AMX11]GJQ60722.1 MAG: hypothetical protein SCALA701_35230 [Candidatus Scalindua sp.]